MPLLPLIADSRLHDIPRRSRPMQITDLIRLFTRRRGKFYIFGIAFVVIIVITFVHHLLKDVKQKLDIQSHSESRNEFRTIRTVIGRYVGPRLDLSSPNISAEILNSNNYNPDKGAGDDGKPVYLPGYPSEQMKLLYSINRFNLVVSDKISVDRKLPDARKPGCRAFSLDIRRLPNTSIIIVFHNEAWSTLVRTVHSILNNSPQKLVAEILLVDDASERNFLGKSLEYYMNNLGSMRGVTIKIIRSKERIGLVRARLLGVESAKGRVLTFLDAHCEATVGWLEPLLEEVRLNNRTAACPVIDIINEETFAYTRSFELYVGAINWGLNFRWYPISGREQKKRKMNLKFRFDMAVPFDSPVMAGGLFSIDREYFIEMGQYDPQLEIWGGENIELSFRLWQCGGQVKVVPCSHVAHVFRKSSPYTFGKEGRDVSDILYKNLARVVNVWMDEWEKFFYKTNPVANRTIAKIGRERALVNIGARHELRRNLGCKNFSWYLDNVWPENFFPNDERFFGKIINLGSKKCLQRSLIRSGASRSPVGPLTTFKCSNPAVPDQMFVYDFKRNLLMTDDNVCLDTGSGAKVGQQVVMAPCSENGRQRWLYADEDRLIHAESNLCISPSESNSVLLDTCESRSNYTKVRWFLQKESWNQ